MLPQCVAESGEDCDYVEHDADNYVRICLVVMSHHLNASLQQTRRSDYASRLIPECPFYILALDEVFDHL